VAVCSVLRRLRSLDGPLADLLRTGGVSARCPKDRYPQGPLYPKGNDQPNVCCLYVPKLGLGIELGSGPTTRGSVVDRGERYDGTSFASVKKFKNNRFERYGQRTNKNVSNNKGG